MKALFEVPGIFYYLTTSEDALTALYLGSAQGKNEVDSSLDHIVRVPPLAWEDSRAISRDYLRNRGVDGVDEAVLETIVATSFGVPRDLIRRCDELLAMEGRAEASAPAFLREIRASQLDLAIHTFGWPRPRPRMAEGDDLEAARHISGLLRSTDGLTAPDRLSEARVLILIWIYSAIGATSVLGDDDRRLDLMGRLSAFGYDLTLNPLADLLMELDEIEEALLVASGRGPDPEAPEPKPKRKRKRATAKASRGSNGTAAEDGHPA